MAKSSADLHTESDVVKRTAEFIAGRFNIHAELPLGYPLVLVGKRSNKRITREFTVDFGRMPRIPKNPRLSQVTAAFEKWISRTDDISQVRAEVWDRVIPGDPLRRKPLHGGHRVDKLQESEFQADRRQVGQVRSAAVALLCDLAKAEHLTRQELVEGVLSALVSVTRKKAIVKSIAATL